MPFVPVPKGFSFQPIAASEVADSMAELVQGSPAGLTPEMAGPKVYPMGELVRSYLRATKRSRPIFSMWMPGKAAAAYRTGANLAPERAVGRRTWEQFLAEQVGPKVNAAAAAPVATKD